MWSARIEVPCVRPSSDWSWRTSGNSVCEMSFRLPTAVRTGPSTFWLAATFKPAASRIQMYYCQNTIRNEDRLNSKPDSNHNSCNSNRRSQDPKCPADGNMVICGFLYVCATVDALWHFLMSALASRLVSTCVLLKKKNFTMGEKHSWIWDMLSFCISQKRTLSYYLRIVRINGLWPCVPCWTCLFISGF